MGKNCDEERRETRWEENAGPVTEVKETGRLEAEVLKQWSLNCEKIKNKENRWHNI